MVRIEIFISAEADGSHREPHHLGDGAAALVDSGERCASAREQRCPGCSQ